MPDDLAGTSVPDAPPSLYPLQPRGAGTEEVESLYSYILSLAGEHSLPTRVLLDELASLPAWKELGHSLGRFWDGDYGANLVGVCRVAKRWADLLQAATGVQALQHCTLSGVSQYVCGIGLITSRPRVCIQCLADDIETGSLPYERLWWRVAAAKCCPRHNAYLVEPQCTAEKLTGPLRIPKRSGVCSNCGSVGHKCHPDAPTETPTANEVWTAQQVRKMVVALPTLAKSDHRQMKDEIAHYCSIGGGRSRLAERVNMAKSQMSHWLRKVNAKTSLPQLLDIANVEQFDLTQVLLGDLRKVPVPGERQPRRKKKISRHVDHQALRWQLKAALVQGKSVSKVAAESGVDISTVAKHEDLYLEIRERTLDELEAADRARRQRAVEEAETVLELLVEQGVTPSMRAASDLTESAWYPSQLRALSLTMLRINLGDQRLTVPLRMAATSHEYRRMLEVSARRLRKKLGFTATADQ